MADEKPAPRGDLGALLRGAGDVARLPADLPLSDEDNGQCAERRWPEPRQERA